VIDQAFGIDEPEFPIVTNWILKDKKFMFRKVGESFTFGQRGTVQAMPNAIITIHKDSPDVYFKDHLIATQTNFNGLITLVVVEDEFALTEITIHPNKEKDIDVKTGVCERF